MPIKTGRRFWALAAAVGVVAGLSARGQDGPTGDGRAAAQRVLDEKLTARWKRKAAEYRIVLHSKPDTALALRDEPALRWTNPVRETDDGLVWLWLSGGRPAAVACFYRAKLEGRTIEAHEFHSLATVLLTATRSGQTVWAPRIPGVIPSPIPGAPRPASTPAERLRQMRALAREFKASVDLETGGTQLRLLSQPLFRYESETDGALFAFVLTTDPEVLLIIDDRPGAGGHAWHYAFARMSNHSLAAKHRDRVVWGRRPIWTRPTRPSRIVANGTLAPGCCQPIELAPVPLSRPTCPSVVGVLTELNCVVLGLESALVG